MSAGRSETAGKIKMTCCQPVDAAASDNDDDGGNHGHRQLIACRIDRCPSEVSVCSSVVPHHFSSTGDQPTIEHPAGKGWVEHKALGLRLKAFHHCVPSGLTLDTSENMSCISQPFYLEYTFLQTLLILDSPA